MTNKISSQAESIALIVECDAVTLRAISGALDAMGVRYRRNTCGSRVLEQIQSMQPRASVILLALDMPHDDPLKIAARLRTDPHTAQTPLILLAHEDDFARLSPYQQQFFCCVLRKPISREQIAERLSLAFSQDRSLRSQAAAR